MLKTEIFYSFLFPTLLSLICQANLDNVVSKKSHSNWKLPLRSRGARPPHTDINAEPCPRLRQELRRAGAHAPSTPKTGLGADIGMLKTVLHAGVGTVNFSKRSSPIVSCQCRMFQCDPIYSTTTSKLKLIPCLVC